MTASVSNDDDDKEAKRFAFSLSFVMTRCTIDAAREFMDHASLLFIHPARDYGYRGRQVQGIPGPRDTSVRVKSELICG
jgi:hypothetical protein